MTETVVFRFKTARSSASSEIPTRRTDGIDALGASMDGRAAVPHPVPQLERSPDEVPERAQGAQRERSQEDMDHWRDSIRSGLRRP
ncbi:MAG TPA: hypothetical protein VD833_15640 [Vicinamibacterales bacterium]|nr:hypothetical protein [Vicinamibacterales bacterium]